MKNLDMETHTEMKKKLDEESKHQVLYSTTIFPAARPTYYPSTVVKPETTRQEVEDNLNVPIVIMEMEAENVVIPALEMKRELGIDYYPPVMNSSCYRSINDGSSIEEVISNENSDNEIEEIPVPSKFIPIIDLDDISETSTVSSKDETESNGEIQPPKEVDCPLLKFALAPMNYKKQELECIQAQLKKWVQNKTNYITSIKNVEVKDWESSLGGSIPLQSTQTDNLNQTIRVSERHLSRHLNMLEFRNIINKSLYSNKQLNAIQVEPCASSVSDYNEQVQLNQKSPELTNQSFLKRKLCNNNKMDLDYRKKQCIDPRLAKRQQPEITNRPPQALTQNGAPNFYNNATANVIYGHPESRQTFKNILPNVQHLIDNDLNTYHSFISPTNYKLKFSVAEVVNKIERGKEPIQTTDLYLLVISYNENVIKNLEPHALPFSCRPDYALLKRYDNVLLHQMTFIICILRKCFGKIKNSLISMKNTLQWTVYNVKHKIEEENRVDYKCQAFIAISPDIKIQVPEEGSLAIVKISNFRVLAYVYNSMTRKDINGVLDVKIDFYLVHQFTGAEQHPKTVEVCRITRIFSLMKMNEALLKIVHNAQGNPHAPALYTAVLNPSLNGIKFVMPESEGRGVIENINKCILDGKPGLIFVRCSQYNRPSTVIANCLKVLNISENGHVLVCAPIPSWNESCDSLLEFGTISDVASTLKKILPNNLAIVHREATDQFKSSFKQYLVDYMLQLKLNQRQKRLSVLGSILKNKKVLLDNTANCFRNDIYQVNLSFDCIMISAAQDTTELESLLPILYKCNKLVLVGDFCSSKKNESLFDRAFGL